MVAMGAAQRCRPQLVTDVRSETGGNQYNVLKWLERQGHTVRRKAGIYIVTPKAP